MPRDGHSLEPSREARAFLPVAATCSFAESLSHFLSVQLQFHPRERGTLVMKCPMGFSSADPSVDSSDCSLTGQQLLTLVLQLPWGVCTRLTEGGRGFLRGPPACLSWRRSLSFQPQDGWGPCWGLECSQQLLCCTCRHCEVLLLIETLLFRVCL